LITARQIGTPKANIVPTAALLATGKFNYAESQLALGESQSLRNLISDVAG